MSYSFKLHLTHFSRLAKNFAGSKALLLPPSYRSAKERDAMVVIEFTTVSYLCMGMITTVCQSFVVLPEHQAMWH